ncbi:MAG: tetratricopeptide repeat protein [Candidatus Wallbacteria bacterium]|nr:tetratricopeptide repeat protein [Candidatus Wallbacteria bacterium]
MKLHTGWTIAVLLTALVTLQSVMLNESSRLDAPTLDVSTEGRLLNQLSYGLRQSLATAVYLRCDEYMHAGDPIKMVVREGSKIIREETMGVSWRLNQEIVTLLKIVVMLDPSFTAAQALLGEHLTRDRNRFREGIQHLHQAVLYNEGHPRLYQLYGQIGDIYYQTKMWPQATGYLKKAIELYARVRSQAVVGTEYFEDSNDRMLNRTYKSYLAASFFELRDWKNCYDWWLAHGEFSPTNRITKWMQIWTNNPHATFRSEDYPEADRPPRTETERHRVAEASFEKGQSDQIWLTPTFPPTFYHKLWFLLTVVVGLAGAIFFKRLW